ncbi:MAG: HAD-IA family hydrolase [Acidobacteria bacterium]|nr:HAD-IA family hydrolase [Acidobacteriota bacterium]
MTRDVLAFDMDGVLVDVSDSYRETIVQTVRHFTGKTVPRELIQMYKNRGGWNDDWLLSQRICADLGFYVNYETVVARFVDLFKGQDGDGLITRERWIAQPGTLDRLAENYDLAIFSGRRLWEAELTLNRCARDIRFDPAIYADDVKNLKPAPDGLLLIRERKPAQTLWYIGDTVDDARSARAAGARFIGVASPAFSWHLDLKQALEEQGAEAVIDDINILEAALANRCH